jgi:hypothetical protein
VEFLQGCLTELRSAGRAADIFMDGFEPHAPLFIDNIPVSPSALILSNFVHPLRPGSSVGIATGYRLDGPGIETRWGGVRFSAPVQTDPGAHPASCTMGTGAFPG